jgi:trk system potassium uptake protein
MINFKRIFNIISLLLLIEAFFISFCVPFSIIYKSNDVVSLLITAAITGFVGLTGYFFTRKAEKSIGKRDGYIIVTMVWIVFSIFGSLPFLIHGSIPDIADAFLKQCQASRLQERLF